MSASREPPARRRTSRRIRRDGIDTSHFLGRAHLREVVSTRRAAPEQVLVVRPPGSARVKTPVVRRVMVEAGVVHERSGCGLPPTWRGEPLTLVIDHGDGDWLDDRLPNLCFLCPNCDAQTATWCRKKGP